MTLYAALVLERDSNVWSPNENTSADRSSKIQRSARNGILFRSELELKTQLLTDERRICSAMFIYNLLNGLIDSPDLITFCK